ncbi:MAG: DUF1304 domain-containing protein [Bdellovibrionota bacterium]
MAHSLLLNHFSLAEQLALFAALLFAIIHVYIFFLESIAWGRPKTNKLFGLRSAEEAAANRAFAFNQGFYNLFLALGTFAGLALMKAGYLAEGRTLVTFCALSIFGAGVVLYFSTKNLRPALIQAGPAFVYLVLSLVS